MLTEEQIREIAVKSRTNFINVAREYIQNQFLKIFYSYEGSNLIFFKGGTALKILYRSPRFSEDLDFSTAAINQKLTEDLLQETMLGLGREGFQIELEESTLTSGGYLGEIHWQFGAVKIGLAIEISGRKKKASGELITVDNPYIPAYMLISLKREELILEKIEALLNRKKPRDFYDLYFMLRANLLPEKQILGKILPLIEKTKLDFRQELTEFLPIDQHRIIKDFKSILTNELKRYL